MKIHSNSNLAPARLARTTASIAIVAASSLGLLVPQAHAQQPVPPREQGQHSCAVAGSLDPACMLQERRRQMTAVWRMAFSLVG